MERNVTMKEKTLKEGCDCMERETLYIFNIDRYQGDVEKQNTPDARYLERHTSIEAITIPSRTNYPTTAVAEIVSIEVETSDKTDYIENVLAGDWNAMGKEGELLWIRATRVDVYPDEVRVPAEESERSWGWNIDPGTEVELKFSIDLYYRINVCLDGAEPRCQELLTHIEAVADSMDVISPTGALAKETYSYEVDKDITEDLMRLPEPERERAMSDYCCMKIRVHPVLKKHEITKAEDSDETEST